MLFLTLDIGDVIGQSFAVEREYAIFFLPKERCSALSRFVELGRCNCFDLPDKFGNCDGGRNGRYM